MGTCGPHSVASGLLEAVCGRFFTQGIGLRPQPRARFFRPPVCIPGVSSPGADEIPRSADALSRVARARMASSVEPEISEKEARVQAHERLSQAVAPARPTDRRDSSTALRPTLPAHPRALPHLPPTLAGRPPAFTAQAQTFGAHLPAFTAHPRTLARHPRTFAVDARTFAVNARTFAVDARTLALRPPRLAGRPLAFTVHPRTFGAHPSALALRPPAWANCLPTWAGRPPSLRVQPLSWSCPNSVWVVERGGPAQICAQPGSLSLSQPPDGGNCSHDAYIPVGQGAASHSIDPMHQSKAAVSAPTTRCNEWRVSFASLSFFAFFFIPILRKEWLVYPRPEFPGAPPAAKLRGSSVSVGASSAGLGGPSAYARRPSRSRIFSSSIT
jgi:hypothetical protein